MANNPELATFCLKLHNSFFMDDMGASFRTLSEAKEFVIKSMYILKQGNFSLNKWVASDKRVLEGIDKDLLCPIDKDGTIDLRTGTSLQEAPNSFSAHTDLVEVGGELNPTEDGTELGLKCLGISYSPKNDMFFLINLNWEK